VSNYNFGVFFILDLGCRERDTRDDESKLSPVYKKLGFVASIWVQSSVVAILTLFCALAWTASLLAEELEKRAIPEAHFPKENREHYKRAMDDWLSQFHLFNSLVERIDDFFNPIITVTVSYFFFILSFCFFVSLDSLPHVGEAFGHFTRPYPALMLYSRLATVVFVCHQLRTKVSSKPLFIIL